MHGGGVKNLEEFEKIISLGIEKVSLSSAALMDPSLVETCSKRFGSQSVVITLDISKKSFFNKKMKVKIHNGKINSNRDIFELIDLFTEKGAGEIVFNFIDRDGTKEGYDLKAIDEIYSHVNIPMTVIGGAGSFSDIKKLFLRYGIIGAGAGSLFVFKGKYNAVLIQYPNYEEKKVILNN